MFRMSKVFIRRQRQCSRCASQQQQTPQEPSFCLAREAVARLSAAYARDVRRASSGVGLVASIKHRPRSLRTHRLLAPGFRPSPRASRRPSPRASCPRPRRRGSDRPSPRGAAAAAARPRPLTSVVGGASPSARRRAAATADRPLVRQRRAAADAREPRRALDPRGRGAARRRARRRGSPHTALLARILESSASRSVAAPRALTSCEA